MDQSTMFEYLHSEFRTPGNQSLEELRKALKIKFPSAKETIRYDAVKQFFNDTERD